LCPFTSERSASPWESTSAARTSCDGASIVLEPGPVDRSSLYNIEHVPNFMVSLAAQASAIAGGLASPLKNAAKQGKKKKEKAK
jgi:hypothetical protein